MSTTPSGSEPTAFSLLREEDIAELNTKARIYRHDKTGARILSLSNDDTNKVFGITFRTPPSDSTGVAHILEHSVLCGSDKYPLKEPFVELIKSSVNTFLNAMTYPDKTVYPVASQNLQDLRNLADVYLDAVLNPILAPHTFEQEGWHYELDEADQPLQFKGVVFNEMKGAYSSPERNLMEAIQRSLFPDTTYGLSSGGNPRAIPDLTYDQFKDFHQTYYHPSNSWIFFYGDDPLDERLDMIQPYLDAFEAREVDSTVGIQAPFDAPVRVEDTYAADPEQGDRAKSMLTVNWVLPQFKDEAHVLAWEVLAYALIGTSASVLRKKLISSGLGEQVTGSGLETDLRQPMFSIGLKGVAREDVDKVEALIVETLKEVAAEGVDPKSVEAALNTFEFSLRENNTGSFPRGLSLMLTSLSTWLHDGDPLAPIAFEGPLAQVKADIEGGDRFFEQMIEADLLSNTHRSTVALHPDFERAAREEAEELARLERAQSAMDEAALQQAVARTQELRALQAKTDPPEVLAKLPTLRLDDLRREIDTVPTEHVDLGNTPALHHDLFTNGILYLDLIFDLEVVPQELLPYMSLFGRALFGLGTQDEDYVSLSQRIGRETGGVWTSRMISDTREGGHVAKFLIRGKGMAAQADALLNVIRDVILGADFGNLERFAQMTLENKSSSESRLIPSGHSVVASRLGARFSLAGQLGEQLGGLDQLFFLRELAEQVVSDGDAVRAKLEAIRDVLLTRNGLLLNVTLDAENFATVKPTIERFLDSLPEGSAPKATWSFDPPEGDEGLTIPAKVNYVGKAANLYDLGYTLHGSIAVIRRLLGTTWLWEKIRVQGGAYGGFSTFDTYSGVFSFLSYRDPNLLETLENYHKTVDFLRSAELPPRELERAIIGTIGSIDGYRLPDAKGYIALMRHLLGMTPELRQSYRDEIFATAPEHFRALADALEGLNTAGQVVVMGSAEAIDGANATRPGWLNTKRVL